MVQFELFLFVCESIGSKILYIFEIYHREKFAWKCRILITLFGQKRHYSLLGSLIYFRYNCVELRISFNLSGSFDSDQVRLRYIPNFHEKRQGLLRRHGVQSDIICHGADAIDQRYAMAETFKELSLIFSCALDK